ncbi:hypothetical protein GCM10010103_72000 [Streptomyces paradoxus]|uniref:Uncharacterized protein n=1 Tax=Streptomyces paradoxus TaxID=66375 RepID=A0A7W9WL36_9ACTN|nr:hypothetical protein [Streptomyces paradoxus]MBB6080929.1 hypothetical protein [Streptomyces paradoxus]
MAQFRDSARRATTARSLRWHGPHRVAVCPSTGLPPTRRRSPHTARLIHLEVAAFRGEREIEDETLATAWYLHWLAALAPETPG